MSIITNEQTYNPSWTQNFLFYSLIRFERETQCPPALGEFQQGQEESILTKRFFHVQMVYLQLLDLPSDNGLLFVCFLLLECIARHDG